MYLTASNLPHYLIGRGRMSVEVVVDDGFMVFEAGRRNRNFKVIRSDGSGLFIKQIKSFDQQALHTLQRETICYATAQGHPVYAPLTDVFPKYVEYDSARHALIVELIPDAQNLTEYHARERAFPPALGAAVGRALGTYHGDVGRQFGAQLDSTIFPRQVPWVLSVHHGGEGMVGQFGPKGMQTVNIIRQSPEFQRGLDAVREEWQYDSLIHGDMKWDNCLVFPGDDDQWECRIVDWELADVGDASWDVGSIFQAYLSFWIMSMQIDAGMSPDQFAESTPYKLTDMQPAMREFWQTYTLRRGIAEPARGAYLARCMRFCAARMVLAVFEYAFLSPQLTSNTLALLQVALNIFKNPHQAVADLVGIDGGA